MTTNHQIAIDLMNEITTTTDHVSRTELYDRLFKHLIEHFSVPRMPKGPKDSPEYQQWLTFPRDLKAAWKLPIEQQEAGILKSPTEFSVPSTFAMVIMRLILRDRMIPMDAKDIPSFLDFHHAFSHLVVMAADPKI